ncbi:MAG: BatA domain-containing protein [Pseudomonadota bacterium]
MTLGWPQALLGLLALALPLWIHLRRQRQIAQHVVSITRYVDTSPPPRRWQYIIEHPGLMVLRMALIAAVTLWLADLRLTDPKGGAGTTWTLVSPRTHAGRVAQLANDDRAFWLAPGRPRLSETRPASGPDAITTWDALWAADRAAPAAVQFVVVGPATVAEIGECRPVLSRPVRWIDAPVEPGNTGATPALRLALVADAARDRDARRVLAVVDAWRDAGLNVALTRETPDATPTIDRPTIWLSQQPVPAGIGTSDDAPVVITDTADESAPVFRLDRNGQVLARGRIAEGRRVLGVAGLRDDPAPGPLFELLFEREAWRPPPEAPIEPAFLAPAVDKTAAPPPTRSLAAPLVWLILLLAAAERALASATLTVRSAP